MLFTAVTGPTYEKALLSLREALRKGVDGVEIRLDTFETLDLNQIRALRNQATPIQVILTLRSASHGGGYLGSEESRQAWIDELCALYPDYVDLEHDVSMEFRRSLAQKYPKIRFVTSYHDFTSTPEDLEGLLRSLKSPLNDVTKIATMASSPLDALRMMRVIQDHRAHQQVIGIALGQHGLATRVLGPVFGNHFDYTYLDSTGPTGAGQLSLEELLGIYHYRSLNTETALFGLIGSPLHKSLGYLVHNAVFQTLEINASYLNFEVSAVDLSPMLRLVRKLPFKGFSVTMPLKESITPFLDQISPAAQAIGAVNTVEIVQGKLIGHNTDGMGALNAIERHLKVEGKRMVIIGSGGAAKAVSHEAVHRGAIVTILNRTAYKAEKLADELHCQGGGLALLPSIYAQGYEIVVNCTPEAEPIPPELIFPGCVAMDLVYIPQKTPFLLQASRKQCRLVYGYEMFVLQALEQQQIWYPRAHDRKRMEEIILNTVRQHL